MNVKEKKLILTFLILFTCLVQVRFAWKKYNDKKFSKVYSKEETIKRFEQFSIDINTADINLLCKLDSIGPKKAEEIFLYRNKEGKFNEIQDVLKVKGIGEKTFLKIKDDIKISSFQKE